MNYKKLVKLYRILLAPPLTRALMKGAAAGTEHFEILRNLPCSIVIDIGANRGQFALIARQSLPLAKIISFEPLKEPASIFRSVFQSDPGVVLHECAIGPSDQEMPIHVSIADDSSSLLPISSLQKKLFPGTGEKEVRTIQVKRLDSVLCAADIQSPALLKLDVQGYESFALEGCLSLLPFFSFIYVECSFQELYAGQALAHEIISFLEGNGFILSGIYNLYYDKKGMAVQGDFLFKQKTAK
ncbi:MAG: FkbM family methyltransferase [Saprospiraceae bacterium]|nr:FkbM family methyltransferase [Saprospiraceae bacterium]